MIHCLRSGTILLGLPSLDLQDYVTEVNAKSVLFIVPDLNDCQHKLDDLQFITVNYAWLIPVGLQSLACWDCGFV